MSVRLLSVSKFQNLVNRTTLRKLAVQYIHVLLNIGYENFQVQNYGNGCPGFQHWTLQLLAKVFLHGMRYELRGLLLKERKKQAISPFQASKCQCNGGSQKKRERIHHFFQSWTACMTCKMEYRIQNRDVHKLIQTVNILAHKRIG